MSEVSNNGTQSGGLNVSSGTVNTGGGDVIGRDRGDKVLAGGNYVAVAGDKSREDVVNILREELIEKNNKITILQNENTLLNNQLVSLRTVFALVEKVAIGDCVNVNEYIIYTHI